jgi:hypothetical protein
MNKHAFYLKNGDFIMQRHMTAYYGLILIGLIYSIPSAPMAYRAWSSKSATTAPRTYATQQYGTSARRFYTTPTEQPQESLLSRLMNKWWAGNLREKSLKQAEQAKVMEQRRELLKDRGTYTSTGGGGQVGMSGRRLVLDWGRKNTMLQKAPGAAEIEEAHTKMRDAFSKDVETVQRAHNRWIKEENMTPEQALRHEKLKRMEEDYYAPQQGQLRATKRWWEESRWK